MLVTIWFNDFTRPENQQALRPRSESGICGNSNTWIKIHEDEDSKLKTGAENPWDCTLAYFENSHTHSSEIPNRFAMGFLEFRGDGKLRDERQLNELRSALKKNNANILLIYVHGWRHSAEKDDENVSAFRRLLSYEASFVRQRCQPQLADSIYCNAVVTGVFVDWPAKSTWIDYKWSDDTPFASVLNTVMSLIVAPTLITRKSVSEKISGDVVRNLEDVIKAARTAPGGHRTLVFGHSLGGNLLLENLGSRYAKQVEDQNPGILAQSLLGDLVVLINPAAEAEKWTEIQKAFRSRVNLRATQTFPSDGRAQKLYRSIQKPLLVSLTSVCDIPDWLAFAKDATGKNLNSDLLIDGTKKREFLCDTATATIFPLYTRWWNWESSPERTLAVGHLTPKLSSGSEFLGATHELEVDRRYEDIKSPTSFRNSADTAKSTCEIAKSWLYNARQRQNFTSYWDSGGDWKKTADPVKVLDVVRKDSIYVQFRHGIHRHNQPDLKIYPNEQRHVTHAITGPNDPFWNVRAFDNAISFHNNFVSYPTWCGISQMLLDDIAAPP